MQDNKERFEEYKKRYKWEMFNTEQLLHEDSEDEVLKPRNFLDELPGKRADMTKEHISQMVESQGKQLGFDMDII